MKIDSDKDCYSIDNMKYLLLFILFATLFSCDKNKEANVSKEQMVNVLYDLTLSSSARNTASKRDSIQYIVDYKEILKKHGLDSVTFIKAQSFYQQDPDEYANIYDSVQTRLFKKLEEIRATKPDSTEEQTVRLKRLQEIPLVRSINN